MASILFGYNQRAPCCFLPEVLNIQKIIVIISEAKLIMDFINVLTDMRIN